MIFLILRSGVRAVRSKIILFARMMFESKTKYAASIAIFAMFVILWACKLFLFSANSVTSLSLFRKLLTSFLSNPVANEYACEEEQLEPNGQTDSLPYHLHLDPTATI